MLNYYIKVEVVLWDGTAEASRKIAYDWNIAKYDDLISRNEIWYEDEVEPRIISIGDYLVKVEAPYGDSMIYTLTETEFNKYIDKIAEEERRGE